MNGVSSKMFVPYIYKALEKVVTFLNTSGAKHKALPWHLVKNRPSLSNLCLKLLLERHRDEMNDFLMFLRVRTWKHNPTF